MRRLRPGHLRSGGRRRYRFRSGGVLRGVAVVFALAVLLLAVRTGLGIGRGERGLRHETGSTRAAVRPSGRAQGRAGRLSAAGTRRMTFRVSALPSLPVPLSGLTLAYAHGALWVVGGLVDGQTSTDGIWRLLWPGGRNWQRVGSLPVARHDAALCPEPTGLWLVGGGLGTVSASEVWHLGWPRTGTAAMQVTVGPPLPVARSDLSCVPEGPGGSQGVIVAGGYDGLTYQAPVLRLGPGSQSWQRVADLPVPVRYAGMTLVGRDLIVFGGLSPSGPTRAIWQVPLNGARPREIGRFPQAIQHVQAAGSDPPAVLGGETATGGFVPGFWRVRIPGRAGGEARVVRVLSSPSGRGYGAMTAVPGGWVYAGGVNEGGAIAQVLWVHVVP